MQTACFCETLLFTYMT